MATLIELAAQLVAARANKNNVSTDEVVSEIATVHAVLKSLENGTPLPSQNENNLGLTAKEAFKKNEVICLVCGKGGFKTLTRHLKTAHSMKPNVYKKQFGIPAKASLSAKSYAEARRKMAKDLGLSDNLGKAREVRKAKIEAKKVVEAKAPEKRVIVRKGKGKVAEVAV